MAEANQDQTTEATRRLAYKYLVISDRDHPVVVTCAAAEVLGASLAQIKAGNPQLFGDLIAWLRNGLAQIEAAEVQG